MNSSCRGYALTSSPGAASGLRRIGDRQRLTEFRRGSEIVALCRCDNPTSLQSVNREELSNGEAEILDLAGMHHERRGGAIGPRSRACLPLAASQSWKCRWNRFIP